MIGQEENIKWWMEVMEGGSAGQTFWLGPDLFVMASLTNFMITLFLTTVVAYVSFGPNIIFLIFQKIEFKSGQ